MKEENRRVSLRLWDVMYHVGVNELMTSLYRDESIRYEILQSATCQMLGRNMTMYRFGSSIEGTTTPGMGSDHDVVHCDERYPVIQDIQQAPPGLSYLMVADKNTKPGYVKLQAVLDGTPLTVNNCDLNDHPGSVVDNMGRVCREHFTTFGTIREVTERSGPADTASDILGYNSMDVVHAYRCRMFPQYAVDSLLNCSRSGWLMCSDVESMIGLGCIFVGVGHPASDEKHLEWRVSFSFQERQLMFKLNPTQQMCYVLLKIIKDMITMEPDVGKSLTSYHCKSCLLSMISKTTPDRWVPENLIDCTLMCLREILQRLHDGNCPNFFVKDNNMFERRVYGQVRERLIYHLQVILQDGNRVFYRIQTDSIGELLSGNEHHYVDIKWRLGRQIEDVCTNRCVNLIYQQRKIIKHLQNLSHKDAELFLCQQTNYLASVSAMADHSQEDTETVTRELKSVLHQLYGQHLASLAFSCDGEQQRLLQTSYHHFRLGMTLDLMSGTLIYGSLLYRQGNIDSCRNELERLEQKLGEAVESVCGCYSVLTYSNEHLVAGVLSGEIDPFSIMESHMAICTIFLPAHIELVPTALQFEFYRSISTPPGSRDDDPYNWYEWAVVDSKVYLYFMQYLISSHLNNHRAKQIATGNLWLVLQQDRNLGHRETGYNLLGWICCQGGHIETAAHCFLQSWKIRPQHNAAKWHMLILIYQQAVGRRSTESPEDVSDDES